MTVEEKAASIISKAGLWWPLAEEDQLRTAAGAYEQVASAVRAAATTGSAGAKLVTGGGNQGRAITAFDKHWGQYDGADRAGLPATAKAATNVAEALNKFAAEVDKAKAKITNLAIEIGATIAVGAGLALFTFGTSAGAAAARTAMLVAEGLAIAAGLTGVAATIVATLLVGAAFGAVEGFIASVVAQVGKTVLSDGDGIDLGEAMSWAGFGAAGGLLTAGGALALRGGLRALRNGGRSAPKPTAAPTPVSASGRTWESVPIYEGPAHQSFLLDDLADVDAVVASMPVGDIIERQALLRLIKGLPPKQTTASPERTVHVIVNSSTGKDVGPIGDFGGPEIWLEKPVFHVKANDYVPGVGHSIVLDEVGGLSDFDLFLRGLLPDQ